MMLKFSLCIETAYCLQVGMGQVAVIMDADSHLDYNNQGDR